MKVKFEIEAIEGGSDPAAAQIDDILRRAMSSWKFGVICTIGGEMPINDSEGKPCGIISAKTHLVEERRKEFISILIEQIKLRHENCYAPMDDNVLIMCAEGAVMDIIAGKGDIGKFYAIIETCKSLGIAPNDDGIVEYLTGKN